jgi:DNA polymerase-3 subunit gamma/tau
MAIRSIAFEAALQDLASLLHRIALAQTIPQAIAEDEPERVRLLELAQQFSPEEIQLNYQIVIHGRKEIDLAPDEYAGFTMTLLRMLAFAPQAAGVNAGQATPRVAPVSAKSVAVMPNAAKLVAAEPMPVQQSDAPQTVTMTANLDWNALLSQLNLQGMARELAKNCVLASFEEGRVVLILAPQFKHLQSNKIAHEKLQSALAEYFVKPIRLAVELGATKDVATPASVEQHEKQARQQQAEEAIKLDAFVREAQTHFGAQVIESSIRPV